MIKKREVLKYLKRETLLDICRNFEVSGLSASLKAEVVDGLMGKRGISLEDILNFLKAKGLKELCYDHELSPESNRKVEIDEEKIEAFKGTISLPFEKSKQIAVKIIDDRGIESLRVIRL